MIPRVIWYAVRQVVMKPASVEATSLSARLVAILASNAKMLKQVTLTYSNLVLTYNESHVTKPLVLILLATGDLSHNLFSYY